MSDAVTDLKKLFLKLHSPEASPKAAADFLEREIVCSPYEGNHGATAGWVVCVDGSPPKGTLVIAGTGDDNPPVFYLGATAKRLSGERQLELVNRFRSEHLKGKDKSFNVKA